MNQEQKAIQALTETVHAEHIDNLAGEMFATNESKTLQLSTILTKNEFKRANELYQDGELDTLQNIIDVFINSINK